MKKLIKWVFGLVVLAVLVVFIVLPMLANTEKGRQQLAKQLGRALDREVAIGGLDVGLFYSSVDVEKLEIMNPEGFPPGPFLRANSIEFDANLKQLLDGRIEGGLSGSGLEVHVMRKGGTTNVEGIGGKKETKDAPAPEDEPAGEPKEDEPAGEPGKGPNLDVKLALLDSKLTVEDLDKSEKLVLEGVSLEMRLTNEEGAKDAGLKIRVRQIDRRELTVRNLEIDAKAKGEWLELENLSALLPGEGKLTGSGRMRVKGGDEWTVKLDATDVGVDEDMMPIVAGLYPFASQAHGQVAGKLGASFDVKGNGLTWEAMKPTLDGAGKVSLTGLSLPSQSLIAQAAKFAGRAEGDMTLNDAGAEFKVDDGWLNFNRLSASGKEARYDLAGRVSLDGRLDLTMDLLPLVKQFGGGETYGKIAEHVKKLPMRIRGTTAAPKYRLPDPKKLLTDVAKDKLEDEIGKKVGGILDKIRKDK